MTVNTSLAYHQSTAPTRTPRMAEYDVIARITQRLARAAQPQADDYPALIAALHENEMLWATLAADVLSPDNQLSSQLRGQIFYLYRFTADHSQKIRSGLGEANAQILIDINTSILRGLRTTGETP